MQPIGPITSSTQSTPISKPGAGAAPSKNDNLFANILKSTNQDQIQSESAVQDLVTGKTDDIQQVVMAVTKAELSFQLFMEIRNHLIDSYNELMRMQF